MGRTLLIGALWLVLSPPAVRSQFSEPHWRMYMHAGARAMQKQQYSKALEHYKNAVKIAASTETAATSLWGLGSVFLELGHYSEAEAAFRKGVNVAFLTKSTEICLLNDLAIACVETARYEEAERFAKKALSHAKDIGGPKHPSYANALHTLGMVYLAQKRYKEAESLFEESLSLWQHVRKTETTDLYLAGVLNSLGEVSRLAGNVAEAETYGQQALDKYLRQKRRDPSLHTSILHNLAEVHRAHGRLSEAESRAREALEIDEKYYGKDHPNVARELFSIAETYRAEGKYREAEPLYHRSLEIRLKVFRADHPTLARTVEAYAALLRALRREGEAVRLELKFDELRKKLDPAQQP